MSYHYLAVAYYDICGIRIFFVGAILNSIISVIRSFAGNYSALLQYLEKDNDSVDVQLWKRLADPVLVHDAFSSFTWLLFCLPLPFPANGAPFTALVHLFYLVSIIQVISVRPFMYMFHVS